MVKFSNRTHIYIYIYVFIYICVLSYIVIAKRCDALILADELHEFYMCCILGVGSGYIERRITDLYKQMRLDPLFMLRRE